MTKEAIASDADVGKMDVLMLFVTIDWVVVVVDVPEVVVCDAGVDDEHATLAWMRLAEFPVPLLGIGLQSLAL